MSSTLAAQLSHIAAQSTNELDLKAQRIAHSKSLIFDRKIASTQDFDTLYTICYEGFQELCLVDSRFGPFDRTIFSEQSKAEDRTQMTAAQNKELDAVIEAFLALVGERLQLSPAVKALEWLVRRFRIHEYNTAFVILTFLPYHSTPLFLNLLSILPEDLTPTFKMLAPYRKSLVNPPRHPLVHSAATNKAFFSSLNDYVLRVSGRKAHYHALIAFWASIVTEAVAMMLDLARSGRREAERQRHEDILLRVLPVLNDAFDMKYASELIIGCYMIAVVLAQKSALEARVLDRLMEAVAGSWAEDTLMSGLVCLSVLAQHKTEVKLPKKVFKEILKLESAAQRLSEVAVQYQAFNLLLGVVAGCLGDLTRQTDDKRLDLVANILESGFLPVPETTKSIYMVLKASNDVHTKGGLAAGIQIRLAELIQQISRSDNLRPIFQKTLTSSTIDINVLEQNLQTVVESLPATRAVQDVDMDDAEVEAESDGFEAAIESLGSEYLFEYSFLSKLKIPMFDRLVQAFATAPPSQERVDAFLALAILGKDDALTKPQFISFFLRVSVGKYPVGTRISALKAILSSLTISSGNLDLQALLPFVLVNLADPSERVRREAANLLSAIDRLYKKIRKDNSQSSHPWAYDLLYGSGGESRDIAWLSSGDAQKILERTLLPELEECILDSSRIAKVLKRTVRGSSASDDSNMSELKKSLRASFFTFLCSQTARIPLFAVKLRLLKLINEIDKVGGTTRTKELQPLLESWRGLEEEVVQDVCEQENLSASELDHEIAATVTPKEKDALNILLSTVSPASARLRTSFIASVFTRMRDIWRKIPEDRQVEISDRLLEISLGVSTEDLPLTYYGKDLLRSVELSGTILRHFLRMIPSFLTDIESLGPAPKRRRTSQNNMIAMTVKDEGVLEKVIEKVTFILELIDSSSPENHPELADGLFQTLAVLHHFKAQIQCGLSYLLGLVLGSLLAIVNRSKTSAKPLLDTSVIRAELVVDCVRTTESPQVQNTALLVVAGLSIIAPEVVLHSVMPIFTFIGSSVLRKDDEYSVSVIDQTIDQVVPALIQSLRNQKHDVVSGTAELLLSFTAAFEHIPSHRRLRLFHALISKLGTQDFLFAVLAMLANRYPMDKDVFTLMTGLVSDARPSVELATYSKFLGLISDSFKPKPTISQVLLGIGSDDGREPQKVAVDLLHALAYLFRHSSLKSKMAETFARNDEKESDGIRTLFSCILEQLLNIGVMQDQKLVLQACADVLNSLFGTLSLIDFLDTIEVLLQRPDEELRRKILRLLSNRVRQKVEQDGASQSRMLDFLPTLIRIVESSPDLVLKHSAVGCIDSIAEKYGKKDPSRVVDAVQIVAGETCMGLGDDRLCVSGVLCLATMAPVLGEAMIPALPKAFSRSLDLLDRSLDKGKENTSIHNAVYALLHALFECLPFMMSSAYLDRVLLLSFRSAASDISDLDAETDDVRRGSLKIMARRVDITAVLGAVERNWQSAVNAGPAATLEALDVVGIAIEKHPKSATVKNVGVLSSLLLKAFDLRREQGSLGPNALFEITDIEEFEETLNGVAIKMIYNLTDTTFRPIFIKLVEWATSGLPKKDVHGKSLSLTTFFGFLQTFFGTLQSIVTNYASYILESVVEVLKKATPTDKHSKPLWLATMRLLRNAFEHDQDEFWQSPSHFTAVSHPLVAQLAHATTSPSTDLVIAEAIPALVELAVAADSSDNHKELNTALMKLLRPSPSAAIGNSSLATAAENPHTRLAALKAEQAFTEQLGEEWLALLPEMLPYISELMEDEDEKVEREVRVWVAQIEKVLGERLDDMLA